MTPETADEAPAPPSMRLWDLPVRVIHWSFVLLLPALWWTWKSSDMATHRLLGYVMLALLAFRIFWGFAGSSTARFASFVRGPRAMLAYLLKSGEPVVGHNPIGGWSVIVLLGLMVAQVVLGLFTQDVDGIESGPLTALVSYDTADWARGWHGTIFYVILGFVALHLCAIAFYVFVRRDNLVGPMVTGRKRMTAAEPPRFAPAWRAALGLVLSAGLAWWVSLGCPIPGVSA